MGKTLGEVLIRIGVDERRLAKSLKRGERKFARSAAYYKRIGKTMTASLTLPLLAAGGASAKLASSLETSFGKIENLVGISGKTLDDFKTKIAESSQPLATSQKDLADALFVITSAGARGNKALNILLASSKASNIGLGETKEVARAATAALTAYQKQNLKSARAVDIMTAIIREGNLEASDLAPTLGRVLGLAAKLDISFEEVGASIATFTRLGVGAEEAVVGLRGVMNSVLKPSKQAKVALAEIGLTSDQLRQKIGKDGLANTLIFLLDRLDGNDEALGRIIPNVRALSTVLGTAGVQGAKYTEILNNIENSTGIVDKGFEKVSKSSAFQFKAALVQLQNVGIKIGSQLLPIIIKMLGVFSQLISKYQSLNQEKQQTLLKVALLVAAIGPLLTLYGTFNGMISTSLRLIGALAPMIITLIKTALGPWGLALAGIAAAGVAVYKNFDTVRDLIVDISNYFIDLYNNSQLFKGTVLGVELIFKNIWTIVKGIGSTVSNVLEFGIAGFKKSAVDAMDEIKKNTEEFAKDFLNPEKIDPISGEDVDRLFSNITSKLPDIKEKISSLFSFSSLGLGGGGGGGGGGSVAALPEQDSEGGPEKTLTSVTTLKTSFEELQSIDPAGFLLNVDSVINRLSKSTVQLGKTLKDKLNKSLIASGEALGDSMKHAQTFKEAGKIILNSIRETIGGLLAVTIAHAIKGAFEVNPIFGAILAPVLAGAAVGLFNTLVPAFAAGGSYGGGLALVGEQGPELINFNRGGQVYNNRDTVKMLGGGGSRGALDATVTVEGDKLLVLMREMERREDRGIV